HHRILDFRRAGAVAPPPARSQNGRGVGVRRPRRHRVRRVAVHADAPLRPDGPVGVVELRDPAGHDRRADAERKPGRAARPARRRGPGKAGAASVDARPALQDAVPRVPLYISVIPPIVIGFGVGVLSAIMGVGGGFVVVPAMIYLLRMPTNVVMGTSLFQILGGVIGAQLGVRDGERLHGEQLRLLLALTVLAVALKLFTGLVLKPDDPFSISTGGP